MTRLAYHQNTVLSILLTADAGYIIEDTEETAEQKIVQSAVVLQYFLFFLRERRYRQKEAHSGAAALPIKKFADGKILFCRWLNFILPFIRQEICRRPARHLPMANVSFADGKLKICNRQVRRWPAAKFTSDKRQI